ncbi:Helix-loop-helix protein delilah [Orchesella cincta]|uniref:Helix-loop-helix protein delilah n=1 Tax=Orchesella cincta TaxID=48709 RepID=A0A1D2MGV3_ORCCI|nr:Helix-loop-helix protein delilah [Orchesella cincta]
MPKPKSRNVSQGTPKSSSKKSSRHPPDKNNNNPSGSKESKKSKDYEKYSLRPRSIQNRIETEKRQKGELKKEPKPKHKPPPLSKYRRKTANARERSRMREINTAYELLQSTVPQYPVLPTNAQGKTCEKLTKITTLRLAMNYIQTLKTLLKQPSSSESSSSSSTTSSLLSAAGLGGSNSCLDIESDTDSIGNSMPSSASSISSCGSSASSVASNCSGSGSEFSPASSYAMSPMSSCSPVGPDCIQTVMRSVVSPAAAAAISANAANLNNLNLNNVSLSSLTSSPGSLGIVAPHQSITTIVTIPSHPHAQAQYSRQLPPTVHHHHHHQLNQNQPHQQQVPAPSLQQQQHHHHQLHTFPPPLRPPVVTSSSVTYMTPPAMTPSAILIQPQHQLQHHQLQQLKPLSQQQIHITTLPSISSSSLSQNPLLCSPQATIVNSSHNPVAASTHNKTKLPPIATTLSSALLRKSMSSFLTDCIQLTNGVNVSMNNIISCNNNGNRTGSLSSLTESDLSEYTNDLLSDEGSVLDEPMFEDIIGVGATDLDLLLGTDSENLGFTADLSAI